MCAPIKALGVAVFIACVSFADARDVPGTSSFATVKPTRLALASNAWNELQFLQTDLLGRVFVFRGSPALEVYRLEGGSLRLIEALQGATAGGKTGEMWVDQARLSGAGDSWILFVKPTTIEVFEGGRRTQTVESHWEVTDLAASAPGLVVAVSNSEINTSTPEGPGLDRPPLVRRWDGKRWETLIEGRYHDEEKRGGVSRHQLDLAAYSERLAFTPEGQLWAASAYAPRLRRFSASGLLEDEIVLGDGKIRWLERKPDDVARQQKEIDAALALGGFGGSVGVPSSGPREVYRGIAVGREGYVYLLAETEQGLALDRYLPSLPTYERVLLSGLDLGPGRPSFVAGRYGFVVGARFGKGGTWELPYEDLATAEWKSVEGAVRNGTEIEARPARSARDGR